jgi:hypothetical protein
LLIFVDDDNVLTRNYLSDAVTIKDEWPFLGVWGSGAIIPEFETQPKNDLTELLPYLALRASSSPQWSNVFPCLAATPWGAGMCVRATVADAYCQFCQNSSIQIASRRGKKILMSGEDIEICYVACMLGCGMGVFPQLRLTHQRNVSLRTTCSRYMRVRARQICCLLTSRLETVHNRLCGQEAYCQR